MGSKQMRSSSSSRALVFTACVSVVVGFAAFLILSAVGALPLPGRATAVAMQASPVAQDEAWTPNISGVTPDGRTFGAMPTPEHSDWLVPDLVMAIGEGDVRGYVELGGGDPVAAASGTKGDSGRQPLYAADGVTVVGYLPSAPFVVSLDGAE
jgi:hypothetical protein